jgi:putative membrane protein
MSIALGPHASCFSRVLYNCRRIAMMRNLGVTLVLSLALCAAGACGDDDDDNGTGGRDGGAGTSGRGGSGGTSGRDGGVSGTGGRGGSGGTRADAGALSDGEIGGALLTANSGEIEQGAIAVTRAQGDDVRSFAQMLITMHNAALDRETALFKMINLTAVTGDDADALKSASDKAVAQLNSASASEFDALYVSAQVDAHQAVLDLIDDRLMPSAQRAEIKNELTMVRAAVQSHLTAAKALLAKLSEALDGGVEDAGR